MAQRRRYITWLRVPSQKSHCSDCRAYLEESVLIFRLCVFFNISTIFRLFQLVAVIDEVQQRRRTDSPRESMSNGYSSAGPSPEPLQYFPHLQHQDPIRGEIEVNEASLKASMSDLLYMFSLRFQPHGVSLMKIHVF